MMGWGRQTHRFLLHDVVEAGLHVVVVVDLLPLRVLLEMFQFCVLEFLVGVNRFQLITHIHFLHSHPLTRGERERLGRGGVGKEEVCYSLASCILKVL